MRRLFKKSKMGKLAALGAAALTMLGADAARAGEYVLSHYEYDGDLYVNTRTPDTVPWYQVNPDGSVSYNLGGYQSLDYSSEPGAVNSLTVQSGSGSIKAVFIWTLSYTGEVSTPPATLYLLLQSEATASGYTDLELSVSNSLGDDTTGSTDTDKVKRGKKLVQIATGGASRVVVPIATLMAKASGTASPSMSNGLWAQVRVGGSASLDSRGVIIVGPTIETSYWKDSLRRTAHERAADGSIVTDSVLDFSESNGAWFARAPFVADVTGFTSPTYKWSGTGNRDTTRDTSVNLEKSQGFKGVSASTDTITVEVTDGPGTDGAKGSNTFKVTWHPPLENTVHDSSRSATQTVNYDTSASSWTPVNMPITVTVKSASVWWSIAGGGSGLLAAATAVWPGGPVGATAGLALAGAGLYITSVAPQDVTWDTTFDYDKYADAVRRQHTINQGGSGTANDIQRTFPASLADQAYPGLTSAGDSFNDPVWQGGGLSGRVVVARPEVDQPWIGDQYNQNGYLGVDHYNIKKQETHAWVNQVQGSGYSGGF